ncbi:MAG: FliH/SctL family protein [Chthoniobacteraceae bacterium]|nr:FliH/SctL family protein [Chthoniobacteraceae bacterium]
MLSCKFPKRPRAIALAGSAPVAKYTEADLQAAREESYQRGHNAAAAERAAQFARHQAEMVELHRRTLEGLAARHDALIEQFCGMLPRMVMEAVRRVLSTVDLDEKITKNILSELIAEVHPGTAGLEVFLNERDLEIFEGVEAVYDQKYPGIRFVADPELRPGDSRVHSRFGTFDGSLDAKIENLEELL